MVEQEDAHRSLLLPEWRNWFTLTTQNRVSLAHVGSNPTSGTTLFLGKFFTKGGGKIALSIDCTLTMDKNSQ